MTDLLTTMDACGVYFDIVSTIIVMILYFQMPDCPWCQSIRGFFLYYNFDCSIRNGRYQSLGHIKAAFVCALYL